MCRMMTFGNKENELRDAIFLIIIYVFSFSFADQLSEMAGIEKSVTAVWGLIFSIALLGWIKKHKLLKKYGFCRPAVTGKKMFYYIPLIIMASVNLWFGVSWNLSYTETMLYIISMLCVGFLEELIFRGFLFQAMCKDGVKTAIAISSITFGIGHIVNLFNGSGADLFSNLLQVLYAIAGGFLFTVLFYRTKSLWPCIMTHGILNALSVFANEAEKTAGQELFSAGALTLLSVLYGIYIYRNIGSDKEIH